MARLPGPPGAPVARDVTSSELTLAWEPPASTGGRPVQGYVVLVQAGGTAGYVEVVSSTGSAEPAVYVRGLAPSTWYEFRVAARPAWGGSASAPAPAPPEAAVAIGLPYARTPPFGSAGVGANGT